MSRALTKLTDPRASPPGRDTPIGIASVLKVYMIKGSLGVVGGPRGSLWDPQGVRDARPGDTMGRPVNKGGLMVDLMQSNPPLYI